MDLDLHSVLITESRVESDEKDIWTISFGGRRVL